MSSLLHVLHPAPYPPMFPTSGAVQCRYLLEEPVHVVPAARAPSRPVPAHVPYVWGSTVSVLTGRTCSCRPCCTCSIPPHTLPCSPCLGQYSVGTHWKNLFISSLLHVIHPAPYPPMFPVSGGGGLQCRYLLEEPVHVVPAARAPSRSVPSHVPYVWGSTVSVLTGRTCSCRPCCTCSIPLRTLPCSLCLGQYSVGTYWKNLFMSSLLHVLHPAPYPPMFPMSRAVQCRYLLEEPVHVVPAARAPSHPVPAHVPHVWGSTVSVLTGRTCSCRPCCTCSMPPRTRPCSPRLGQYSVSTHWKNLFMSSLLHVLHPTPYPPMFPMSRAVQCRYLLEEPVHVVPAARAPSRPIPAHVPYVWGSTVSVHVLTGRTCSCRHCCTCSIPPLPSHVPLVWGSTVSVLTGITCSCRPCCTCSIPPHTRPCSLRLGQYSVGTCTYWKNLFMSSLLHVLHPTPYPPMFPLSGAVQCRYLLEEPVHVVPAARAPSRSVPAHVPYVWGSTVSVLTGRTCSCRPYCTCSVPPRTRPCSPCLGQYTVGTYWKNLFMSSLLHVLHPAPYPPMFPMSGAVQCRYLLEEPVHVVPAAGAPSRSIPAHVPYIWSFTSPLIIMIHSQPKNIAK